MSRAGSAALLWLLWLLGATACRSHRPPRAAGRIGKALAAALGAADHARAPWRCTAADLPALRDADLAAGGHTWHLHGHAVARADAAGSVTIGVVADAGGPAPATLAALGRLRAKLDAASPDLVVVLGGMASDEPGLEATLGVLAAHASYPVVALPGDLEPTAAVRDAVAALRGRGEPVVDGRLARWIELPGVTVTTVPGAGAATRLVSGDDGCAWDGGDVAAIYRELAARPGLRVVATAEPPRENIAGDPVGALALVPPAGAADVIIHGPARETPSPARSGDRGGKAIALSPGIADATTRLPDPHAAAAGVLVVHDASWSWRPIVDSR